MIANGAWILAAAWIYAGYRVACWLDARATDRENVSVDGFGPGVMPEAAKRIPSAVTDRQNGSES